jgi:hypothetical protein
MEDLRHVRPLFGVPSYLTALPTNEQPRAHHTSQDYLGHRSIASTVRYTALAPERFKHFWRD